MSGVPLAAASLTAKDGITFEVSQAYYEENRVFVAYRMSSGADLIALHEGAPENTEWTQNLDNWIVGEIPPFESAGLIKEHDWLNGQGQRWLEGPYDVIDGVSLDGKQLHALGGSQYLQQDGSLIGWMECEIPEEMTADTLNLNLLASCVHAVKFQDYTTFRERWDTTEQVSVPFTVKRNTETVTVRGVARTGAGQAQAEMTMGKVDLYGTIRLASPEQFKARKDLEEDTGEIAADLLIYWDLYRNGQPLEIYGENQVSLEGADEVIYRMQFPYMDDLNGLQFVPQYARSGAHADEAIQLEK